MNDHDLTISTIEKWYQGYIRYQAIRYAPADFLARTKTKAVIDSIDSGDYDDNLDRAIDLYLAHNQIE